jgi:Dcp1-like decapping family
MRTQSEVCYAFTIFGNTFGICQPIKTGGVLTQLRRDSYPPYGFYILNRVGMEDYIQRLYPEDSMQAHESYLMMRSYPTFTSRRLALAHASLPPQRAEGPASKFAREFAISDPEKLLDGDKGASQTVSLWCFATDARDPMQDVMIRSAFVVHLTLFTHFKKIAFIYKKEFAVS